MPLGLLAQDSGWPSPEVAQMYNAARGDLMRGNIQQAIITYRNAIQLAPEKMILYRDLGQAYYLAGEYDETHKILEPIIKSGEADAQSFQIAGSAYVAQKEKKKAKNILQKGLERYPHSGLLFHELGRMYEMDEQPVYALETWLDGIEADPAYHINYYEAARMYMGTQKPVWAVIYAEMFLNIEQQTPRANETRDMLLGAYQRLYKMLGTGEIPKFKGGNKQKLAATAGNTFEEAVEHTYLKLSPVVSDGITTENLIMLRTRFLMEWMKAYAGKYPISLFNRLDDMLRNGYFDVYNQWVFGKIDNPQQFDAWKKFHPDAIPKLEAWLGEHPYRPVAADFYNSKKVDGIFIKEKKDK
jgi:tetratricopeptide (TPR) repeat protein